MNRPSDSVRVVMYDRSDTSRFLILTEADDAANWKLPGGKFDTVDETPIHAAGRELQEELGAGVVMLRLAGQLLNDDGVSVRHIFVAVASLADVTPSDEIAETKWITEDGIPDSPNGHHILSAVHCT